MSEDSYEDLYDTILDVDCRLRYACEDSVAKNEYSKASVALGRALHWLNCGYEKEHPEIEKGE